MKLSMCVGNKFYKRVSAVLIGVLVVTYIVLALLGTCNLMQSDENNSYVFCITIWVIVLSLLTFGLFVVYALLKRFRDAGGSMDHSSGEVAEIAVTLEKTMNELRGLLQSVQVKAQGIDRDVEVLTEGIQQVLADQTNLFSLNAAIESVRSKQDGFSIITGEVFLLVEHTRHLANDVRNTVIRLRAEVNKIIAELEHMLRRVDINRASTPGDASADASREKTDKPAS